MFNLINKKKLLFISVLILSFTIFIPNVKSISDTVYLEYQGSTPVYSLEASEGNLILWEFRTYDNPFIVYFRCSEWRVVISHSKTANKGILEVLESNTFHFYFDNIGQHPTQDGYLEFEIKVIKRIQGYNSLLIFITISFVSIISILTLKRIRIT